MTDKNVNHQAVGKMADGVRIAFLLSLITNVYDIYNFIKAAGDTRQGISIALGIVGTILIWLVSKELRAEKKRALYFWLVLLSLGYFRWVFIDAAFAVNVISIALLFLAIILTVRIVIWMREGVLA